MRHKKNRLLFILKHREQTRDPSCWNYSDGGGHLSSGLYNSVRFIVDMLRSECVDAKLVHVVDNNQIDREVKQYNPTHVFIEAFWVVPEKFDVLMPLHKNVKWIVRNHSKSEFLASEGIAFGWGIEYLKRGIELTCNSLEEVNDWRKIAVGHRLDPCLVTYTPNYYPLEETGWWIFEGIEAAQKYRHSSYKTTGHIDIGCFGAIRPLKNHVNQAIAAIDFADDIKAKLRFHINASRIEGQAAPIYKNLCSIFEGAGPHKLVQHDWMDHDRFRHVLKKMEIVMQVTFSETFNIVAADALSVGTPVVGSNQLPWLPKESTVDPNNVEAISQTLRRTWKNLPWGVDVALQQKSLKRYSKTSKQIWLERFK